jgi:hypothetical protein
MRLTKFRFVGLRRANLRVPEDLLELIDQHEQIERLRALCDALGISDEIDQSPWPASELGLDEGRDLLFFRVVRLLDRTFNQFPTKGLRLEQCSRQAPHRPLARPHDRDSPVAARTQPSGRERGQHACPHEARLAGAGWSDHREEPVALQDLE